MTLREELKRTTYGNVKIGAYTNFLYCGKPDVEEVQKISDEKREEVIWDIARSIINLREIDGKIKGVIRKCTSSYLREYFRIHAYSSKDEAALSSELTAGLSQRCAIEVGNYLDKKAEADLRRMKESADKFSPWVGLLDRQVTESYPSVTEYDTKIIIIEGSEVGRYWTTEEFMTGLVDDEDE